MGLIWDVLPSYSILFHSIPLYPTMARTIYLLQRPCQENLFRFFAGLALSGRSDNCGPQGWPRPTPTHPRASTEGEVSTRSHAGRVVSWGEQTGTLLSMHHFPAHASRFTFHASRFTFHDDNSDVAFSYVVSEGSRLHCQSGSPFTLPGSVSPRPARGPCPWPETRAAWRRPC